MNLNAPFVIVGAGFYGSVIAERIANVLKKKVIIIEKRDHIGGNSWSEIDPETGIEIHKYGSHIFHTNNKRVWEYLNQFSSFNNYKHKVISNYKNENYFMPINLLTINKFFNKDFSENEARDFISNKKASAEVDNFEEKGISEIGSELYEAFFKNYTEKQWQTDAKELPASTFSRLPIRFTEDTNYFDDAYQGIPIAGYSEIFKKMLSNELIDIRLKTDFFEVKHHIPASSFVIYTGPIDKFFEYKYGELGWRTLDFKIRREGIFDYQSNAVVNFPEKKVPFTRIHEFKHYHPERDYLKINKSILYEEYSRFATKEDTPYYPINTKADLEKLKLYENEALKLSNVHFGGRLGMYKYFDMHHVIAFALKFFEEELIK
jgi:UDP-galactopyranose mutase